MSSAPPSGPPHSGSPETLDFGGGQPLPPPAGRRRGVLIVVGAVAAIGVAGATWAALSFFSSGPQPAQALPGSTIGYVSVDLDPSGGQKIEALRTLRKFPAFKEHIGLDTDDDIREWIFGEIQGDCGDLDYADDIEPWLGDRFAAAAVDVKGDGPAPVFVLQVSDEDAAAEGLAAIKDCNDAGVDEGAWVFQDGWVLLAETQEIADQVAADAARGSLADDEDFQHWTDEIGDIGVISMYAAPEAGKLLVEDLVPSGDFAQSCLMDDEGVEVCEEVSSDDTIPVPLPQELEEATKALEDFRGAAATIRFDDGGVELELAADGGAIGPDLTGGDAAGDVVSSLPADTVAALGFSLADGWFDEALEQFGALEGEESIDGIIEELSAEFGIELPEDAEALVGDAVAVAVGPEFDIEALESSSTDVPGVGVKIIGDADEIDGVLDKVRAAAAGADEGLLDSDTGDGAVAVGPDEDYRAELVADGGLGDSDAFRKVVEHADGAAAILFLDLDAGSAWIADFAGDDEELRENLEPLEALGLSSWRDGETVHAVLKITSD